MSQSEVISNLGKQCRVNSRGDFAMDAEKGAFIGTSVTLTRLTKGGMAMCKTFDDREISFPPKNLDLILNT